MMKRSIMGGEPKTKKKKSEWLQDHEGHIRVGNDFQACIPSLKVVAPEKSEEIERNVAMLIRNPESQKNISSFLLKHPTLRIFNLGIPNSNEDNSSDIFANFVDTHSLAGVDVDIAILDCRVLSETDFQCITNAINMIKELNKKEKPFIVFAIQESEGLKSVEERVLKAAIDACLLELTSRAHLYPIVEDDFESEFEAICLS
eukprot:TRINITY_DN773043_c0_g1_i1.p1 TRINITY_DN773043_c0_g1~~TRINITY_DN773043_c0_g1_i1.p1  ORF type:complete len:202 (-),score=36.55 TRINITY_DN773043_c0_g1_i1:131-736(-)